MIRAKDGDTVRVQYTGRLDDGSVFDSSVERETLQFTIGKGQVLHGVCLLYTSPSPRDGLLSRMPSSA